MSDWEIYLERFSDPSPQRPMKSRSLKRDSPWSKARRLKPHSLKKNTSPHSLRDQELPGSGLKALRKTKALVFWTSLLLLWFLPHLTSIRGIPISGMWNDCGGVFQL